MLNKDKQYYIDNKSIHTVTEIFQQPTTWVKTINIIKSLREELTTYLKNFDSDTDIYLTGAGTSEFVGNTIRDYINVHSDLKVQSVSSTDIVLNPRIFFKKKKRTLLVSFGRSGSSPESTGAVDLLNQLCDDPYHLIVTCNSEGNLSKESRQNDNYFLINLPEETHDQSFAMTSSYTNMMLATILAFNLDILDNISDTMLDVNELCNHLFKEQYKTLEELVNNYNFERIIYLGSGELKGMAQEAQLKMLELTAGNIVTMYDSPLGFRHGPKSIINNKSLTVLFLSDYDYTRKYELDLLKEMLAEKDGNEFLVLTNRPLQEKYEGLDYLIELNSEFKEDMFLVFPYIIVAQLLGLFKATSYGISSDNPCPSGSVNRVVKGVTIYKY